MIRVWYKLDGEINSCKIEAPTKTKAIEILKSSIPSAKIGSAEKI